MHMRAPFAYRRTNTITILQTMLSSRTGESYSCACIWRLAKNGSSANVDIEMRHKQPPLAQPSRIGCVNQPIFISPLEQRGNYVQFIEVVCHISNIMIRFTCIHVRTISSDCSENLSKHTHEPSIPSSPLPIHSSHSNLFRRKRHQLKNIKNKKNYLPLLFRNGLRNIENTFQIEFSPRQISEYALYALLPLIQYPSALALNYTIELIIKKQKITHDAFTVFS